MPVTCLVVGCRGRNNRDDVRLFSVPAVLSHRFLTHKNELSERRRALWIEAINRDDLTPSKLKYQKVCSYHFITGKPAALEDENNPDWVPSQNMNKSRKIHRNQAQVEIIDKKRKLSVEQQDLDVILDSKALDHSSNPGIEVGSQTDITMIEISRKFEQLFFASKTIERLEKKIDESPFGLRGDHSNDKKWKYYTGFSYTFIECLLYKIVKDNIITTSVTSLKAFNQLLLTLIKLRLNLDFRDLAYQFRIHPTTASTYFENGIDVLYTTLQQLIIWPDHAVAKKNIPSCFQEAVHDKTAIILSCFEVLIEKPASLKTQMQCWSSHKHHHTVKFLIGFTPQGTVSYISKAWGGRISDKQIVENSDFLNFVSPGDVVLANRGFLMRETVEAVQSKFIITAFTKVNNQLQPLVFEGSRPMAHIRIHISGMLKNKFNILKDTVPITLVKKGNNPDNLNILDKIVTVCCGLINLSPSVVPL